MKTGDVGNAGTDSTIRIEIFGTYGHMSMRDLRGSFERDDTDTTTFYENFGEPYLINLYHSGSGIASGWKLDKVILFSLSNLLFILFIEYITLKAKYHMFNLIIFA